MKKTLLAALSLLTLLSAHPGPARADLALDDVAPPLSFCFGKTSICVMPDLNLSTVNYDLDAKKWDAGVTSVGVGYMLLFASDRPYASGIALHGAGQWSQTGPSYFALVPTVVLAKYFEVGVRLSFMDGSIGKYLTLGLGANADVIMSWLTGKNIRERLAAKRLLESTGGQP